MKIGVFSGVYWRNSQKEEAIQSQKLEKVMSIFKKENVDLCFCVGNLVDQERQERTDILKSFENALELIHMYDIPFYLVTAPQDFLRTDIGDLTRLVGLYHSQYTIHADDTLLIVLDGNYTSDMRHCEKNNAAPTEFYLPPEQILSLKKWLKMRKKCVVLSYHNVDGQVPSRFTLKNADEVMKTINESSCSKIVVQAAYPYRTDIVVENTRYITVPSMRESTTELCEIIEI